MADHYDVIVIGGGLGGLTAAALIAQAGRKTLLIERNHEIGGAASTYNARRLVVEASLHETSDPQDHIHRRLFWPSRRNTGAHNHCAGRWVDAPPA